MPVSENDPRPALLMAGLSDSVRDRTGVRATARVSLSGSRGASFARQLLLLERPARLRVEVLGLLGQRVAVLVTDGDEYDLYRAETGTVERGSMHPAILWEVAGVPLTPEQAVALLLGAPRTPPQALPGRALESASGTLRLEWEESGSLPARALEFDPEGRLQRYELGPRGDRAFLRVEWSDYRDVAGEPFAHRVDLVFPRNEARAEVSFKSVELNPDLPAGLFQLELAGRVEPVAPGPGPPSETTP